MIPGQKRQVLIAAHPSYRVNLYRFQLINAHGKAQWSGSMGTKPELQTFQQKSPASLTANSYLAQAMDSLRRKTYGFILADRQWKTKRVAWTSRLDNQDHFLLAVDVRTIRVAEA